MTYQEIIDLLPTWARRTLPGSVAVDCVSKANARARGEAYGIDKALFTDVSTDEFPADFGVLLEGAMVEVRRWEDDPESAQIHGTNYERALAAWQKTWDQENLTTVGVAPQMQKG